MSVCGLPLSYTHSKDKTSIRFEKDKGGFYLMVAKHQTIHSALSLVHKQTYFVNTEKACTVSLGMPFERCIAAMGHQIPVSV